MSSWKSKPRKNTIRKGAKFDSKTPRIVAHLQVLGMTYEDIGFVLGVSEHTVSSWVQRYPIFVKEIEKVREAVKSITVAQMLKAAWGYDYEEVTEYRDKDGNLVKPTKFVKKHQPGNADLLKFIVINKDPDNYKDVKRIDVTSKNLSLGIAGELEENAIDALAGVLTKHIESKEIKKELDEGNNSRTVPSNNT